MKVFKTYSRAAAFAKEKGYQIVRIDRHYVVGKVSAYSEIALVSEERCQDCGIVCAKHLDRLGNANHAQTVRPIPREYKFYEGVKR